MIHSLGSVVAIVILISVITPGFLLAGMLISGLYTLIGAFYLRASRDLKRLESIQRSPLFQHFGETLSGVSTIRAYGDERRFVRENLQKIDDQNRPFFYLWACNRWLGFRVDIAGALVSFFAGVFVIIRVGKIDAGLAGLSLTYAITFTDNVLWLVRLYANNEQCMNSVERIREYLEVEQEAPEIIEDNRPPASWPDKGAISFKNYSTRYRADLDPVLRNISFTILSGEKIGIVGRTGAGKSSLALALFRSLEAETGSIEIDGIDISKIGLKDLRQSITMVPQDPTLFTGTIRSNLDPFGINTDSEVFAALKRVHLINEEPEIAAPIAGDDSIFNKNIFLDLQSPVAESGNNLSQGQRYGRYLINSACVTFLIWLSISI
jgi:ABC-type multidrug transport system fused ATPase/permease subunit